MNRILVEKSRDTLKKAKIDLKSIATLRICPDPRSRDVMTLILHCCKRPEIRLDAALVIFWGRFSHRWQSRNRNIEEILTNLLDFLSWSSRKLFAPCRTMSTTKSGRYDEWPMLCDVAPDVGDETTTDPIT